MRLPQWLNAREELERRVNVRINENNSKVNRGRRLLIVTAISHAKDALIIRTDGFLEIRLVNELVASVHNVRNVQRGSL